MRSGVARVSIGIAGLIALAGCSSDSRPETGGTTLETAGSDLRQRVLATLTNEVFVPSYQRLADGAATLLTDVQAACASLDDNAELQTARDSWSTARGLWLATRAFRFGPATTLRTMSTIDFPIDPAKIDNLIAGEEMFTDESLGALGSDQRGLGGIEHVLFGPDPLDARSCSYLVSANQLVVSASAAVLDGWTTGADGVQPFADQLIEPGRGGLYATEHEAYEDLINNMIFAVAEVADSSIGRASGDVTGTPAPEEVDAGRARRAGQDAIDVIAGVQTVFDGAGSGADKRGGIGTVVASISGQTRMSIDDYLDGALAALEAVPSPLAGATDPSPAHAAYRALKLVQVTLRTEVASQLGVTLTFGDADGDS